MVLRNVAAMIHRHATFRIQPVRLNGTTQCSGGNLPPSSPGEGLVTLQALLCAGSFSTVVDSSAPLAFCPVLCYAVYGATSTPAGGFPRCYSGVYFYFAPVRYRKGVLLLVTWPNLIEFCSFLVALITLIIGIIDHKNKK